MTFAPQQADEMTPAPGAAGRAGAPAPSLDTVFGPLLAGMPLALMSADGIARARRLARRLPPATALLLELPLAGQPAGVDLSIRIDSRDDTRAIVEGRHPTLRLAPAFVDDPAWRRVAAFCAAWRDPAGPLALPVETAWLEFDDLVEDAAEHTPRPLFYFSHPRNIRRATAPIVHAPAGAPFSWVTDPALQILLGEDWAQALGPTVRDWLADPEVARLRHVGVIWSRAKAAARLCVTVQIAALDDLLAAKAPLPQAEAAVSVVRAVAGGEATTSVLHLDLAPGLGPTLGFELAPAKEDGWPRILDRLVAGGLSDGFRRQALLDWRSAPLEAAEPGSAPRARMVTSVSAVLADGERAETRRRINHVKLTARGDGKFTAKVYLSAVRASRLNGLF
jgi:hypothetical protein